MAENLVGYSRAGDVFHYRWAARRCLRLIYPNSTLQSIYIEGSADKQKAGEYVLDITEYYETPDKEKIKYYQLKHSTVQTDDPFTLSDLKDTIVGFAKRFIDHSKENGNSSDIPDLSFTIVTNRRIDETFKQNVTGLAKGETIDNRFKGTIEKYTTLSSNELARFCSTLQLSDGEGNYNGQRDDLRTEIAQLLADTVDTTQIDLLVALVQKKVLPDCVDGKITKEEVFNCFGITFERDLYPAPGMWENIEDFIEREQHQTLSTAILGASSPIIIHAAGGVGKSVFCRQIVNSLPQGSLGIAYDCFGAGSYRNSSERRHRHRDALVQIVNELSTKGLCGPLLVQNNTLNSDILKTFLLKIETSVKHLRKTTNDATLVILIDAADNAEMAAKQFNEVCFAHELLREKVTNGCKLVFLCRTERISLLKPSEFVPKLELNSFSESETFKNLAIHFPEANLQQGVEFHRLTSGNPRVQANALDSQFATIINLLTSLGPIGTTVEVQINSQLQNAVSKIKDSLTEDFQPQIDSICRGLAILPPNIPIEVLSKAANVSIETVKSFVSDMGRALWLSDSTVQFRDEPTETWFIEKFHATIGDLESYIAVLEPLAQIFIYVAEVLPQLYLQAKQYTKLIDIALSDEYLPKDNPIEERNVRVYRLQFAFKAAIKEKKYKDAVKLAMRAGEEVAGNQRQTNLLQNNIDLLVSLQSVQKVREIAFKKSLSGDWQGSENVYAASLLSGIKEFKGEAGVFLRAAVNWLAIYFDDLKSEPEERVQNKVEDSDIFELAYAHLNIYGVEACFKFLTGFKPGEAIFRIVQGVAKRLIDGGSFGIVDNFLEMSIQNEYFVVAMVNELLEVGRFPKAEHLQTCLTILASSDRTIEIPRSSYDSRLASAIISFAEACLHRNLSSKDILDVLAHFFPVRASQLMHNSHQGKERSDYLRTLAIRCILEERPTIDFDEIIPETFTRKEKDYKSGNEIGEFKEVVNGLLPWFLLRASIIGKFQVNLHESAKLANEESKKARNSRYRSYDSLPFEICSICSSILIVCKEASEEIAKFYCDYLETNKAFGLSDKLTVLRAAFRNSHLAELRARLEQPTYELIKSRVDEGPDEISSQYITLARAVCVLSPDDASVYFEDAVNIVSKFGDEIVQRWQAIVSIAMQSVQDGGVSGRLAYRFIRCAEVVGENVGREKYWNRSEAIRVCTKMSPGNGISALSRWRDRDIGSFDYQFAALSTELVESEIVSPALGWALGPFYFHPWLNDFTSVCLRKEQDSNVKQKILDDAVQSLERAGAGAGYWEELNDIALSYSVQNSRLFEINQFFQKQNKEKEKKDVSNQDSLNKKSAESADTSLWDSIFLDLDISNPDGIRESLERFEIDSKRSYHRNIEMYWREALKRLQEKDFKGFLDGMLLVSTVTCYDIQTVFRFLPTAWVNKASFKKRWPDLIMSFGRRYSQELVRRYTFNSFVGDLKITKDIVSRLNDGICEGLTEANDFADANTFFDFVIMASSFVTVQEASDLVDYSLLRFELHVDEDTGDGQWAPWLCVPDDNIKSLAGFIWSALGSPRAAMRWNAAHCVRKLAEFHCVEIIDALVEWMEYGKVDAFGCNKFPFYDLHARLFLFIALSRISIDKPELLTKYSSLFSKFALKDFHVLIQKFSSKIAINLEEKFSGTFGRDVISKIRDVGKSKMPLVEGGYNYTTDSYWHANTLVNNDIDFHFGLDIDSYWFEPLGRVFGVPRDQIEDLAASVIVTEWGINPVDKFITDPRSILWNRHSDDRETWGYKGSYRRTDDFNFYLSYHAMLVVAAKLIEKMPVVARKNWDDGDQWGDWLGRHSLMRPDDKWLSDIKDPVPLSRPKWILQDKNDKWEDDISDDDFLGCLKRIENNELWINVQGGWQEKEKERTESYTIRTALVSKEASEALLNALATCSDPNDYKLPEYDEDDIEIDSSPFSLKGWIYELNTSKGLDEFDLNADQVDYPAYSIGDEIIDELSLVVTEQGKIWSSPLSPDPALICQIWSSYRSSRDEEPDQIGKCLKARLSFLKHLCSTQNCELIFEVRIKRERNFRYEKEKSGYKSPERKIYLLSSDGKLRTTDASYQLG